jgi:hypothetical protein
MKISSDMKEIDQHASTDCRKHLSLKLDQLIYESNLVALNVRSHVSEQEEINSRTEIHPETEEH